MNKEDKIKELTKDMGIGFQLSGTTRFGPVAAELVEMGYKKIEKDDIVISKEEYRCLKSIEKLYDPFWFCTFGGCEGACKECKDTCEMSIFVKERKEMTEKIIAKIKQFLSNVETVVDDDKYSLYPEIGYKCSKVDEFIDELEKEEFAKQLGVEIKE